MSSRTTKIQETTTTTTSKVQKPTKYSEQIVRIGRRGDTQEYVTKKYEQPTRVVSTQTKVDPKTGATQRYISTNYQPEAKIVTETRRRGTPTETKTTTTTTKYQPSTSTTTQVTESRRRYGGPTSSTQETTTTTKTTQVTETRRKYAPAPVTTTTTTKYQPSSTSTQVTETKRKYGPLSTSTKETTTTTTTTKYQPSTTTTTQVTESRRKYGPLSVSTNTSNTTSTLRSKATNLQPSTQGDTRIKIGPSANTQKDEFVTVPIKVTEKRTRYGPDSQTSKQVTYTTYQPSRAKPLTNNYVDDDNNACVVSEKRCEKYVNDNGREKKEVTVEKTTADGTKKREYRRFFGSK